MKEIKFRSMNIDDLIPANYNPRKDLQPEDEEYKQLKKSIEKFGYVENIIFNKRTGHIVGGHQRQKVLKDLGYTEVTVAEIDISENEEKALNIGLNKIEGEWDYPKLKDLMIELEQTGLDLDLTGFSESEMEDILTWEPPEFGDEDGTGDDEKYTTKIDIPQYQITGEKPEIEDLFDLKKSRELVEEIEKADLPEEEKNFLKTAAFRHSVFNYRNIAEYYAHASADMQRLMEKSALVIIDFNDAIKNGYVTLSGAIEQAWEEEEHA